MSMFLRSRLAFFLKQIQHQPTSLGARSAVSRLRRQIAFAILSEPHLEVPSQAESQSDAPDENSGDVLAIVTKAEELRANGDFESALALTKQIGGSDQLLLQRHRIEAAILRDLGRFEECIKLYHSAVALDPIDSAVAKAYVDLLVDLNRLSEYEGVLRGLLIRDPSLEAFRIRLVALLRQQERVADAEAILQTGLVINPVQPTFQALLADLLSQDNRPAEALAWAYSLAMAPNANGWDHLRHSQILRKLGRLEEALLSADRIDGGNDLKAFRHRTRGEVLRDLGRFDASLASFQEALVTDPSRPSHAVPMAGLLVQLGRHDDAVALLRQQHTAHPDDPAIVRGLINLLTQTGDLSAALAVVERHLDSPSTQPADHLTRISLLRRLDRPKEALSAVQSLIEAAGTDSVLRARSLRALGEIQRDRGQLQASLDALQQAVQLHPNDPGNTIALASLLMEICAFEEGLKLVQDTQRLLGQRQGLMIDPWLKMIQVHLLRCCGDLDTALTIAEALCSDPRVSWEAQLQRAALFIKLADERATQAVAELRPGDVHQQQQALYVHAQLKMSQYRFDEALALLADRSECSPDHKQPLMLSDLPLSELSCLLRTLLFDLEGAQNLYFRIRAFKQASENSRLAEGSRNGIFRCLMEEFFTSDDATSFIRLCWGTPPDDRLQPLASYLSKEPESVAVAISLLITARLSGGLDAWARQPMGLSFGDSELSSSPIPDHIIQYWDQPKLPDGVRSLMQSWPQANPSLRHIVFDNETARSFIAIHGSKEVQEAYDMALSPTIKSDLFSLAYLFKNGGIYADAGNRCRHSLKPLLSEGVELIVIQEDLGSIGNNFIASVPSHPFIGLALEMACRNVLDQAGWNPWFLSGSGVLSLCFANLYQNELANSAVPPPKGLQVLTQHTMARWVSFHLQPSVKVSDGSWKVPHGIKNPQLIRRKASMAAKG
ncbi:MAG: tetratricopeptide repeat protein [Prochlorococcaceae cyanobacterium]